MQLYEYNSKNLLYQQINKKKLFYKPILITILIGIVISILISIPFYKYTYHTKEQQLILKFNHLNLEMDEVTKELNELQEKDKYIYHGIILNEKYSGKGGIDANLEDMNYNIYQIVEIKLDFLFKEINKQKQAFKSTENKIEEISNIPSILPIEPYSYRPSSGFGLRIHPIYGTIKMHTGVDFGIDEGSNIYSTAHGIVEKVEHKETGYGYMVLIKHKNNYKTRYAHLSIIKVNVGDIVYRGQLIALSGNTGTSTSSHLHYETIYNNKPIDPINFYPENTNLISYKKLINFIN